MNNVHLLADSNSLLSSRSNGSSQSKWSSQAVRIKAKGLSLESPISAEVIYYLQEFKAQLNQYASQVASVFPVEHEASLSTQNDLQMGPSSKPGVREFEPENKATDIDRCRNFGDLTPISEQSNELTESRICSALSIESNTYRDSVGSRCSEEKFKSIEPSTRREIRWGSSERTESMNHPSSNPFRLANLESTHKTFASEVRSSLLEETSPSNSFRVSRQRWMCQLDVGQENRVGRINSAAKPLKIRKLGRRENKRQDRSNDQPNFYRKVTLQCMIPDEHYNGCLQELVNKANNLGVIVLR